MSSHISTWYSSRLSKSSLKRAAALADQVLARDFSTADLPTVLREAQAASDKTSSLVTVFAAVREAVRRVTGLALHRVQVIGGVVLTERRVAEMKTGEGKTLTLVAPVVWAALRKAGVHVVTANPYLARRDSESLRPIYESLGLSVGCVDADQSREERRAAYACDVTYGVNSEFGFDYLRDLRIKDKADRVQRGLASAFVDELDAILIDDARTPLILSGVGEDRTHDYRSVYEATRSLVPGVDYVVDERERSATVTDSGYAKAEAALVGEGLIASASELYAPGNSYMASALAKAVQARALYLRGRDYMVDAGTVVLLDTATGRTMAGRRLEDGLHEMLEAKEGVAIQRSTQVLGSVTYQNFFSLYQHLCGLTGTAFTEAEELLEVYGLETVVVPTHRPVQRDERPDVLVADRADKVAYAVSVALDCAQTGQPLLIGTGSVREAHLVASALRQSGLAPAVLTAEHVAEEAEIVAQAGRRGALTVATSIAGRGTDIVLGGEGASREEAAAVAALGGLFVLGFGRNALRRVDLQLLGRSARQGDRGTSQFVLCLDDELLRSFAQNAPLRRAAEVFSGGGALAGSLVSRLVSAAQQSAERQGFEARQSLQKNDLVVSEQRLAFFDWRDAMLEPQAASAFLADQAEILARAAVTAALDEWVEPAQWPVLELKRELRQLGIEDAPVLKWAKEDVEVSDIAERLAKQARSLALAVPPEAAKQAVLTAADEGWSQHLATLDELNFAVQLTSKIGKNSTFEFSKRAFDSFAALTGFVGKLACSVLSPTQSAASVAAPLTPRAQARAAVAAALDERWVTRNEPCPCGSGKRFKLCHGKLA